eukprot:6462382-Amphidinium_carterae.6
MAARAGLLTQEQTALLVSDFEAAVERVEATIIVKTAGWSTTPLSLAGLAHWDVPLAKRHARSLLQAFRTLPPEAATQEHPLTR